MTKKLPRSASENLPIPVERIERQIFLIRGHKVMLDSDLAELYAETTTRLNQQVRRNMDRFPEDFAFQLTQEELDALMLQIATSKTGRGGRRKLPWVFTEQGVAMLSSVLRGGRAVLVNIAIMRAFVRLREMLATHKGLARKMADLEREQKAQGRQITEVFSAIQKLLEPPKDKPRRAMGFQAPKK